MFTPREVIQKILWTLLPPPVTATYSYLAKWLNISLVCVLWRDILIEHFPTSMFVTSRWRGRNPLDFRDVPFCKLQELTIVGPNTDDDSYINCSLEWNIDHNTLATCTQLQKLSMWYIDPFTALQTMNLTGLSVSSLVSCSD